MEKDRNLNKTETITQSQENIMKAIINGEPI